MQKIIYLAVSLMCLLLVSACGFKLRGAYQLPAAMQVTYLESADKNATISRALKRRLEASDIKMAENVADDVAVLRLFNEIKSKRIISVDSKGRAREYTLTYGISFSVKALGVRFEIEKQDIRIDRDFVFDTEDVLGNSREESRLYEEMQQDIIRLILLRLQSKA
jgi:LPS-assembly lipoprotein